MNPLDTDPIAQVAAGGELDSSSSLTKFESLAPSFKEIVAGTDGSVRRTITYYALGWLIATSVRVALFNPLCVTALSAFPCAWGALELTNTLSHEHRLFGAYLIKELGPVERESVRWGWILAVRALDLALGAFVWKKVEGFARKDGGELLYSSFAERAR
jgi:hypothetical protein